MMKMHTKGGTPGDDDLQETELLERRRVLALRHRLPVEGDEIAVEIDKAITGYTRWVTTWLSKPHLEPEEVSLPDEVAMPLTAALVLVTANLPGRIEKELG